MGHRRISDVLVTRGQICTMALLNGQMELSSNSNVFDAMVAGRFKGKVVYVSAKALGHRFIVVPEIKSFECSGTIPAAGWRNRLYGKWWSAPGKC